MKVELDLRRTARQNADSYYEESKWAKGKSEAAQVALKQTERELKELEETQKEEKKKEKPKRRKEAGEWYEKFRWSRTSGGFLVIGGRDATQNEVIFKKHTEPKDVILHADITGAPLTVIKSEGKEVPLTSIKEAACIAACYSTAWRAGHGSVDVYWVKPDQVSKTAKAGEYLGKGAFMIRGTKNYLKKMELRLAVGVVLENKIARAVAGPPDLVKSKTKYFVVIRPGSLTQSETAKQAKKQILLKAAADEKELIEGLSIDDFQKVVPAGKSTLTKS